MKKRKDFIETSTSKQRKTKKLPKLPDSVIFCGVWKLPSLQAFNPLIKKNLCNFKTQNKSGFPQRKFKPAWKKILCKHSSFQPPKQTTITSLLGPATEQERESSRSSGSTEMFSLDKTVVSPLFLAKKMGRPVQEPAPKMLSPNIEGGEET